MPGLVLILLAVGVDAGSPCGAAPCAVYPTPLAAFEAVLATPAQILAVGEYHEQNGAPKVQSAIKRFTQQLLPALGGKATSLIVETWITTGKCGAVEKQAAAEVKKVTKRPESTEDEVTTLLNRSYDLGLKNHILLVDCDEYQEVLNEKGELDALGSLKLVRRKVEEKAREVIELGEGGVGGKVLLLYGGAVHNDVVPLEDWAEFAFGRSLTRRTDGGYTELDLLVPEYVAADEDLLKEAWFAPALKLAQAGKTVLVNPHPRVFMLLFPKTAKGKVKK